MTLTVGEMARVTRTPPCEMPGHDGVGQVGVIEWLTDNDQRARIKLLTLGGEVTGAMFVPLDCLEPVNNPAWKPALARLRRSEQQALIRYQQRLLRQQQIETVADKYQMTVDAALEIAAIITGKDTRHYYY